MDLDNLDSSGDIGNNNNRRVHCPPLAWSLLPIPGDARMKNEPLDWSFPLGRHPSSSTWMPRPYFSSNANGIQAACPPVPLTFSSLPALSQLGTNTGSGSSMTWMQKQKEPIFVESKPMLPRLPSPGPGWGGSGAGSSSHGQPRNKDDDDAPLVAGFADGLFTQDEITTIKGEKTLAEIVLANPKGVRRIIRNRSTAQRSKQRKMAYLSDLESKAELLQQETNSLSARVE
nr:transcription factor HY5-like [Aegilops tauschii subsp. strangulata]